MSVSDSNSKEFLLFWTSCGEISAESDLSLAQWGHTCLVQIGLHTSHCKHSHRQEWANCLSIPIPVVLLLMLLLLLLVLACPHQLVSLPHEQQWLQQQQQQQTVRQFNQLYTYWSCLLLPSLWDYWHADLSGPPSYYMSSTLSSCARATHATGYTHL